MMDTFQISLHGSGNAACGDAAYKINLGQLARRTRIR
jgi:hypothetical protein